MRTSVYHPGANGVVERFHRVLRASVQSAILQHNPWKATVTEFLQVVRATPHAITGLSPFELLHGRKMHTSSRPFTISDNHRHHCALSVCVLETVQNEDLHRLQAWSMSFCFQKRRQRAHLKASSRSKSSFSLFSASGNKREIFWWMARNRMHHA